MEELIYDFFGFLSEYYALYLLVVMGGLMGVIMFLLSLIKKPIKKLTAKIQDERLRKLANKCIILLSFGISIGGWYLLHTVLPQYFDFDWVQILLTGTLPIVVYALQDGVINAEKAKEKIEELKTTVTIEAPKKEKVDNKKTTAEQDFAEVVKQIIKTHK